MSAPGVRSTQRPERVVGWSLLLAPRWWHVPLDGRRERSVHTLLDRLLRSLPRDQIGRWRRELAAAVQAQLDQAVRQGATDAYLLVDLRHGLPVAATCLAIPVQDAPPSDTPAEVLAAVLADQAGDEPGVLTVEGRSCARIRRHVPALEASSGRDGTALDGAGSLEEVTRAMPATRLEVYIPFPDEPFPDEPGPYQRRMLLLAFSTPLDPVADAMVALFEAMAESLRWRRAGD